MARKPQKRPAKKEAPSRKPVSSRKRRPRRGVLVRLLAWLLTLALWGAISLAGLAAYALLTLPPMSEWAVPAHPPAIEIRSAQGVVIARRGNGGEAVRLAEVPAHLPQAVLAIEDRRFYQHFGIDLIGLGRAILTNLSAGRLTQGGSGITQQLAKNLFLKPERTLKRKLQESVFALWLEARYSKDEILEMYLNRVYLGGGAYGVDAAARRYFAKPARAVTLAEAALLAGLLKAPSRLSPFANLEGARARAGLVLGAMVEEGFITPAAAQEARAHPARLARSTAARGAYAADWVMALLPAYIGAPEEDLIIETTIDDALQAKAEAALRQALTENGARYRVGQGALVALDDDGAVKALVGGRDYMASQFNRAVEAHRQPGSTFKPFVYLAALEAGYRPEQLIQDEPISIAGWTPQNYSRTYLGPVTLAKALALSLNTVPARLAAEIGPWKVARAARRLGILSPLHDEPSIALGTAAVTPLEMTAAYVPFANGGMAVSPFVIRRIESRTGKVLFANEGARAGHVVDPVLLGAMNRMLQDALEAGTGQKAVLPGRPAAGKTGTSQDFRDAWFIGYVPGLTVGIWLGNDDNSPTRQATGGMLAAALWRRFMQEAVEAWPVAALPGTELRLPPATVDTRLAAEDGLPALGPDGPVLSRPLRVIPLTGPSDSERRELERLLQGMGE